MTTFLNNNLNISSMKTILTNILLASTIFLTGCINFASGSAKITHVVNPVIASSTDQVNNAAIQDKEESNKTEENVVEDVGEEIELKPLPLDF